MSDAAGNVSEPVELTFNYTTQAPTILTTRPADGEFLGRSVSFVSATLMDNSDMGLDLEKCSLALIDPDGVLVPGTFTVPEPSLEVNWNPEPEPINHPVYHTSHYLVTGEIRNVSTDTV